MCEWEVGNNFPLKEEERNKKSDKTSNKQNQGNYKNVLLFIKFTYFKQFYHLEDLGTWLYNFQFLGFSHS